MFSGHITYIYKHNILQFLSIANILCGDIFYDDKHCDKCSAIFNTSGFFLIPVALDIAHVVFKLYQHLVCSQ